MFVCKTNTCSILIRCGGVVSSRISQYDDIRLNKFVFITLLLFSFINIVVLSLSFGGGEGNDFTQMSCYCVMILDRYRELSRRKHNIAIIFVGWPRDAYKIKGQTPDIETLFISNKNCFLSYVHIFCILFITFLSGSWFLAISINLLICMTVKISVSTVMCYIRSRRIDLFFCWTQRVADLNFKRNTKINLTAVYFCPRVLFST